jgi:hypothetical protein
MSKYPSYPTFEGELLSKITVRFPRTNNVKTDVMGCQAALFEWTESYDSKVCVLTAIILLRF